ERLFSLFDTLVFSRPHYETRIEGKVADLEQISGGLRRTSHVALIASTRRRAQVELALAKELAVRCTFAAPKKLKESRKNSTPQRKFSGNQPCDFLSRSEPLRQQTLIPTQGRRSRRQRFQRRAAFPPFSLCTPYPRSVTPHRRRHA